MSVESLFLEQPHVSCAQIHKGLIFRNPTVTLSNTWWAGMEKPTISAFDLTNTTEAQWKQTSTAKSQK